MAGAFSDAADAIGNAGEAIKKTSQGMGDSMSDAARRAAAASEAMGEAYRTLDVQSTAALQRIATQAQKAFETIRNSGTASTGDVQRAFAASQDAMRDYQNALNGVSSHSHEAAGGTAELLTELLKMGGIALTAGALEHLATEALSVYANFEKTTIAITALTGSVGAANQAIDEMRAISKDDALSFPTLLTAYQRMLAFGFQVEQIPGIMRAAADTAAATGSTIERVARSIDRMAMSGAAGAKQLATLGLTTKDMAAAMNVAESQVKATFKALDESQRVEVLTIALDKFRGTAEQMAESLSGQWQSLKNKAEITFEDVGKALAPAAIALIDLGKTGLESTEMLAKSLQQFSDSVVLLAGQIKTIGGAFGDLVEKATGIKVALDEAKAAAVLAEAGFSATLPTWKALATVWGQAALALQVLTDNYPKSLADLKALTHQATTSGAEFKAAFDLSAAQAGLGHLDEATQKVVDGQAKLQKAVDDSRHALDVLTTSYQTQTVMANGKIATDAQVRAAQDDLTAAVKKLEGAHRSHVLTLGELAAKQVELNADVVKAQAVYDAAAQRMRRHRAQRQLGGRGIQAASEGPQGCERPGDGRRAHRRRTGAIDPGEDRQGERPRRCHRTAHPDPGPRRRRHPGIRPYPRCGLKQIGTTIDAFRGEIDVTSEYATNLRTELGPALAAIDLAHIQVAQNASLLGSAFHDIGIKSTAEYKDLADKLAADFKLISESGTSSAGDVQAAQEKLIKAQENLRDSLTPTAAAFKGLGLRAANPCATCGTMRSAITRRSCSPAKPPRAIWREPGTR